MKWLFLILFLSSKVFCGGAVGNGGGFAKCIDLKLYSYDYLLTFKVMNFGGDYVTFKVEDYLGRISFELKRLREPLSGEFDQYVSSLFKQVSGSQYQWFSQQNLPLMWEPELDQNLPNGCKQRKQAVYYFAPFAGVSYSSYKYDPYLIKQVLQQKNGALQVSYLIVHEWLWNLFDRGSFMKLAIFNKLLHSNDLSRINSLEFSKYKPNVKK